MRVMRWRSASHLLALAAVADFLPWSNAAMLEAQRERTVEVLWSFTDGLEGWGNTTTEEADLETYARGGELHGNVRGPAPHLDSPHFWIDASDRHYVALRLAYAGFRASARGKIWVRYDNSNHERVHDGSTTWASREYVELTYSMVADSSYHVYYVPIHTVYSGPITQIRVFPAVPIVLNDPLTLPRIGHTLKLDWIRIAKAPSIWRIEGCTRVRNDSYRLVPLPPLGWPATGGDVWSDAARASCTHSRSGRTNLTRMNAHCNTGVGAKYFNSSAKAAAYIAAPNLIEGAASRPEISPLKYATVFNCLRRGGERIVITGTNFGASGAIVTVDGEPCKDVVHAKSSTRTEDAPRPERQLSCTTPPARKVADAAQGTDDARTHVAVVVANGVLPGLYDSKRYFAYAARPPLVPMLEASNIASSAFDISWSAPRDYWEAVAITGYDIAVREIATARRWTVVVGNVTTTTLVALSPKQQYEVSIRAMSEDQTQSEAWLHLDLYGRRLAAPDAVRSHAAAVLNVTTLAYDIGFAQFDANTSLKHGSLDHRSSFGHLNISSGEGDYGLTFVGTASVENCNATTSCCDGFSTPGAPCSTVCGVRASDSDERIVIGPAATLWKELRNRPVLGCGPALRLTGSRARQSGAVWYARQQQVREGFDTSFTFRLSQPSFTCKSQEDVFTHCRSRGADGFAFVVHNSPNAHALGRGGRGIGYDGISNSIAVEFDTWYNPELLDAYENHVAVHSRGWRHPNSANASYALATATWAPRFTDADFIHSADDSAFSGIREGAKHEVRIKYSPLFDESAMLSDRFFASAHVTSFMENGQFSSGGMAEWGTGMGTLSIFLDDLTKPLLILPLNLGALIDMKATDGRAWVGFTAATGDSHWQAHDITKWEFASTRVNLFREQRAGPPLVNSVGAHVCDAGTAPCVHP